MEGLFQTMLYGLLLVSPSLRLSAKNSTLATDPSVSDALAARVIAGGAKKKSPLAGLVSWTDGGWFRIIAGTACRSITKNISELLRSAWCTSAATTLVPLIKSAGLIFVVKMVMPSSATAVPAVVPFAPAKVV